MIGELTELLDRLDEWAEGKAAEEFVFPLVLETTDDLDTYRSALRGGSEPLRARLDDLEPEHITEDKLGIHEQATLALALLIQGYQFVRDHRDKPRQIHRDIFRVARRAYRLLKVLGPSIAEHEGDRDWSSLAKTVTECRRAMKPIIAERLRASRERAEARKFGDAIASVSTAENLPGGPVTPRIGETSLGKMFEETVDTELLNELENETQEIPKVRKKPSPTTTSSISVEPNALQATDANAQKRRRTTIGVLVLVVLGIIAAVTLVPKIQQHSPNAGVYEEHLPVSGVVRLRDDPRAIIVIVDDRWDAIPASERQEALAGFYERANELEDVNKVTVRDARGRDAARIVDGSITLLTTD